MPPKLTLPRLAIAIGVAALVGIAVALPSLLDDDSASETDAVIIGDEGERRERDAARRGPKGGNDGEPRKRKRRGRAADPQPAAPAPAPAAPPPAESPAPAPTSPSPAPPAPAAPPPAPAPVPDDGVEDDDDDDASDGAPDD